MLQRISISLLLVAALLIPEPLIHTHPLRQSSAPCAICAVSGARIPTAAPSLSAPQIVVYTLTTPAVSIAIVSVAISVASRAPPAL